MNKTIALLSLGFLYVFSGCHNNPTNPIEENNSVIATSTKYGDFQLVLELEKLNFDHEESININVYFKNIGSMIVTLDGILPYRNSSNPPRVTIWSTDDSMRFEINEILQNLLNEDDIVVDSGKSVMLMSFNLTDVGGFLLEKDEYDVGYTAKELENVYSSITKGSYNISADFWPTPNVYYCITDTLTFSIN